MSYNYSKLERNKVYVDPEGTVARYQVVCTNHEEYKYKNAGFLMLYLTQHMFIIRSAYNPALFSMKGLQQVYLEIPFSSISSIKCCGEDFSQIIDLSNLSNLNAEKNDISIEFRTNNGLEQKIDLSINCYISLSKNAKECQELIDLFNKTVCHTNNTDLKLKERPLYADKIYLHCPILNVDGKFLLNVFYDRLQFKPENNNYEEITIQTQNIISLTHEQNLKGKGRRLKQDNFLRLICKDYLNKQITIFIKFDIINNAYPKKYIDFLTVLQDLGLI